MSSKYHPDFVKKVINLGAIGLSYAQIAAELEVSVSTLKSWTKHPEHEGFADAYKMAKERAEAFHEQQLLDIAIGRNKGGNAPAMMYYMNNRFKESWGAVSTQKIDMTTDVKKMTDKELDDQIKALITAKVQRSTSSTDNGTPATI